ncbi:hypothetical protein [Pseudoalteromonas luteoviolacea]|uniref:Uncharacterized protein n=1 Tax=Pseudoalteromonas luteoviolacea H33 TaxID=1365251 RepID=A0A167DY35_9GAMM|nr:hypothetical protein [Pseudoalteromonas luteoviolacea]KZN49742.1 hypothetical protein N476_18290 [Pseudoalteromonas luteoviolacea H33]KZN77766.1 hypothetical protein N477_00745 [Pseudoalteromonas luteoviolacea H33-S]
MQSLLLDQLHRVTQGVGHLKRHINKHFILFKDSGIGPWFISSSNHSKIKEFDEKHYFVIPFVQGQYGVALHTIRSLPPCIPEIKTLPKRRVFHFANEHAETLLSEILSQQAESLVRVKKAGQESQLDKLANDIDALDTKLTYGMFVVGGLSAFLNPAVGAAIAAKAALPSITGLVNRHGIRPLAEKYSQNYLEKEIQSAQEKVLEEFSEGDTIKLVNPMLSRLEKALQTSEQEYDPLLDEAFYGSNLGILEKDQWALLTVEALSHVYQEILDSPQLHNQACLGEEDIRWLTYLFDGYLTPVKSRG